VQPTTQATEQCSVEGATKLHLLLPGETWVWPGIRLGYQWTLDRATMTTVSLAPKVIFVEAVLSKQDCEAFIEAGSSGLYRSPEKHYSDDPKFRNYRTSMTANPNAPIADSLQRRAAALARLPQHDYCEPPQLTRYQPGEWYKQHQDYFKGWERRKVSLDEKLRSLAHGGQFLAWRDAATQFVQSEEGAPGLLYKDSVANPKDVFELNLVWQILNPPPSQGLRGSEQELTAVHEQLAAHGVQEWRRWLAENLPNAPVDLLSTFMAELQQAAAVLPVLQRLWQLHTGMTPPTFNSAAKGGGPPEVQPNRHVTMFLYLNADFEGGETVFPLAQNSTKTGTDGPRPGMEECSQGLAVVPVLGSGALFYSKHGDGRQDDLSMHGGCPPLTGTKFGANCFMWNVPFNDGYRIWQSHGLI